VICGHKIFKHLTRIENMPRAKSTGRRLAKTKISRKKKKTPKKRVVSTFWVRRKR